MYRDGERTRCPVCEDAALDGVTDWLVHRRWRRLARTRGQR